MSSELPCGKMPAAIQKMLRQSKKCCGNPKNTTQQETQNDPTSHQRPCSISTS
jgi:hypothetical protein